MYKKVIKAFIFLLFVFLLPYKTASAETLKPTDAFYVNDYADVISDEVEDEIITYGSQLDELSGAQVVLVTVDFTDGESLEDYALKLFNDWGIGSKEKNNGLLILLSVGDDDYWAMQGEGLEDTLTSGKISSILQEYLEPDFANKDYSAGAEKTYGAFIKELGGQWKDSESAENTENTETAKEDDNITADEYTFDFAHIIDDKTKAYINKKSTEAKELYGAGFYLVTKHYSDKADNFQDDTIKTFEDLKAGGRDVLLVLYKDDDNYWLLPGEETEEFAYGSILQDILDTVLEPEFAVQNYSQGAQDTADRFYSLFQKNYKKADSKAASGTADASKTAKNPAAFLILIGIVLILLFIRSGRRRSYNVNTYGVPYNPYGFRGRRHRGYWGNYPPPPMGGRNYYNGGGAPPDNDDGAGRRSSGGGFWGSSGGAGRSSSGSSFSGGGSSSSRGSGSTHSSGGGSSRGGGGGRASGGFGGSGSSGHTSSGHTSGGGRSASGGGGVSRGGGAGRSK